MFPTDKSNSTNRYGVCGILCSCDSVVHVICCLVFLCIILCCYVCCVVLNYDPHHHHHPKTYDETPEALTICTKKPGFFRMKCQMERFNPVKIFRNKRNTFEGIPLFSFQPK